MLEPAKCKRCEKEFTTKNKSQRFCSQSCAASFNLSGKPSNNRRNLDVNPLKVCQVCGGPQNSWGSRYCSNKCQQEEKVLKILALSLETGRAPSNPRGLRSVLRRILPWKCSICGITEWCGKPAPLEADHIDGDYTNNLLNNLRWVCGNCGMQLPIYKGRNRGSGRFKRMERYRVGKSY